MLNNIDKEIKRVPLKMQNFRKIAKLRCRKICEPQNCKINFLRKISCIRLLIIKSQLLPAHYYAEDTQLYLSFCPLLGKKIWVPGLTRT